MTTETEESAFVFRTQREARQYVENVVYSMIDAELEQFRGTIEGWFLGDVTHEPTRRRIEQAARALMRRLAKAAKR